MPSDCPYPTEPSTVDGVSDPFQVFTFALLAIHNVTPAFGRRPARCRACDLPAELCAVWSIATGLLGLTWSNGPTTEKGPAPTGRQQR